MSFRTVRRFSGLSMAWTALAFGAVCAASLAAGADDHTAIAPAQKNLPRLLLLQDYNTRVVLAGTAFLGLSAGAIGVFLLLRKRALLSDAISHATLPGIVLAFILTTIAGGDGKRLPVLLSGAVISGAAGMLCINGIRLHGRLKDDAALGIVLSVFFGVGIALLGIATRLPSGHAAGLHSFIYGKTASMLWSDAALTGSIALLALISCLALFKEFTLLCFDPDFAASNGYPTTLLDVAMMALVVSITVVGLQSVGLILVVALLVIPPVAARYWTDNVHAMFWISALIGGLAGWIGASLSALLENLPAGAIIVLVASFFFAVSAAFGSKRGLMRAWHRGQRLAESIRRQNLLRAMYEQNEGRNDPQGTTRLGDLPIARSWTPDALRRTIKQACRDGLLERAGEDEVRLTCQGLHEARRIVRNHRLWELYLMSHADVAPTFVDQGADTVEHVLDPSMIQELESMLPQPEADVPPSPHRLPESASETV